MLRADSFTTFICLYRDCFNVQCAEGSDDGLVALDVVVTRRLLMLDPLEQE